MGSTEGSGVGDWTEEELFELTDVLADIHLSENAIVGTYRFSRSLLNAGYRRVHRPNPTTELDSDTKSETSGS